MLLAKDVPDPPAKFALHECSHATFKVPETRIIGLLADLIVWQHTAGECPKVVAGLCLHLGAHGAEIDIRSEGTTLLYDVAELAQSYAKFHRNVVTVTLDIRGQQF